MEWDRVIETELMLRLVGGYAETVCGKLKSCKGFLIPNFERGPKKRQVHFIRWVGISWCPELL